MKRIFLALFLTGILLTQMATIAPKADQGIRFEEAPWSKILEKAQKEKKMIFFDAYASWCGPCKALQKNVFTHSEVGSYFNANFINVKKDMEVGEGPQLAQMYPLEAYPTLFILDSKGKLVKYSVGYLTPDQLLQFAKSVKPKK